MPQQRRSVPLTSVRLEFGPDISVECPHAPSPSLNKERQVLRDYESEFGPYQQPILPYRCSPEYGPREKANSCNLTVAPKVGKPVCAFSLA